MLVERESLVRNGAQVLSTPTGGQAGVLLVGRAGAGTTAAARALAEAIAAAGGSFAHWPRLPAPGASATAPEVLLVDDITDIDEAADRGVFDWLADRDGAHRAILTARHGPQLPPLTSELWAAGVLVRLEVPNLTHVGVEAMAAQLLGGPVTRGLNDYLMRASGGMPLLVRELVNDGLETGTIVRSRTAWVHRGDTVTGQHLRDFTRVRLSRWPADEREALELIACAGGAPVRVLLQLVDERALDACERRGMVAEISPGMLRVQPPGVERAVRESMSTTRRSVLRQRLAAIIADHVDPDDSLLLRAATWALDDGLRPAPGLAVRASWAASRTADYSSARRLAAAALGTAEDGEARLALGHALVFSGAPDEARDVLSPLVTPGHDPDLSPTILERAAIAVASLDLYTLDRPDQAQATLDAAVRAPGSRMVDAHRLASLAFGGCPEAAIEGMEALVADPATDDHERCVVWPALIVALTFAGRGGDAMAHGARALAVAPRVTDRQPFAMSNMTSASFFARLLGGWGLEDLPMIGDLAVTPLIQLGLALPLIRHGDADRALVETDKALAAFMLDDALGFTAFAYAAASTAAVLSGKERRGAELLELARTTPMRMSRSLAPEIDNLLLWPEFFLGGVDHVTKLAREHVAEYSARGLYAAELAIRHSALRLGVRGLAPSPELLARVDSPVARAIEAQFQGLADGDAALLLGAAEQFQRFGERVCAAEAAAQAHTAARATDARTTARTAALKVRSLTAGIDTSAYPLLRDWSAPLALTPREREVAVLASQQLTNREIARRLRSSPRTVEAHLHRAYSKLGVSDRSALRSRLDSEPR